MKTPLNPSSFIPPAAADRERQIQEIVKVLRRTQIKEEAQILALYEPRSFIPTRRDHAMLRALGIRP